MSLEPTTFHLRDRVFLGGGANPQEGVPGYEFIKNVSKTAIEKNMVSRGSVECVCMSEKLKCVQGLTFSSIYVLACVYLCVCTYLVVCNFETRWSSSLCYIIKAKSENKSNKGFLSIKFVSILKCNDIFFWSIIKCHLFNNTIFIISTDE